MRWPVMLRRTHSRALRAEQRWHDAELVRLLKEHDAYTRDITLHYQERVNAEYLRARNEGIAQVHAWAVEVNYNVFHGAGEFSTTQRTWIQAALQDAERKFRPARPLLTAPPAVTRPVAVLPSSPQGEH